MNDSWDDRRKAQEEQFFQKENELALKRLKEREKGKQRLSPISGKPMEQITMMGVVVDRCAESGGIWLDAGELEQIMAAAKEQSGSSWIGEFFSSLSGKKIV